MQRLDAGLVAIIGAAVAALVTAACGMPTTASTAENRSAILRADLRLLAMAQESVYQDSGRYTLDLGPARFRPSAPAIRVRMLYADSVAFAAEATRDSFPERCVVFAVEARGLPAEVQDGEPFCPGVPRRRADR